MVFSKRKKKSTSKYLEPPDGTKFGERVFADIIKEPEMRLSWIIWIGPNPTASVLKAEEKIHESWKGRMQKVTRSQKRQGRLLPRVFRVNAVP